MVFLTYIYGLPIAVDLFVKVKLCKKNLEIFSFTS